MMVWGSGFGGIQRGFQKSEQASPELVEHFLLSLLLKLRTLPVEFSREVTPGHQQEMIEGFFP